MPQPASDQFAAFARTTIRQAWGGCQHEAPFHARREARSAIADVLKLRSTAFRLAKGQAHEEDQEVVSYSGRWRSAEKEQEGYWLAWCQLQPLEQNMVSFACILDKFVEGKYFDVGVVIRVEAEIAHLVRSLCETRQLCKTAQFLGHITGDIAVKWCATVYLDRSSGACLNGTGSDLLDVTKHLLNRAFVIILSLRSDQRRTEAQAVLRVPHQLRLHPTWPN